MFIASENMTLVFFDSQISTDIKLKMASIIISSKREKDDIFIKNISIY